MRETATTPPASTNTPTPSTARQHRLPLSCRECQRKKVKCDRSYPCGQCSRAGHSCTPSTRKPRAKVGSRAVDIELRDRIAKLEKLVETFQGDEYDGKPSGPESTTSGECVVDPTNVARFDISSPSSGTDSDILAFTGLRAPEAEDPPAPNQTKYRPGSFLSTLTTEVQALREAFEDGDVDDEDEGLSSEPTPPQALNSNDPQNPSGGSYELLLCPPGALFVMPGVLNEPEPSVFTELCNMYLVHMEQYQKIFHGPTLEAFLFRGRHYLGNDPETPCNRAIKAAICFAGLAAMTDDEAMSKLGQPRDKLVVEYRRMADVAIYQTDPMNTTEIAALQALVVYTAAVRMIEPNRRAWTLLGLITRIARALNIHRETPHESIFRRELCRRLWYTIVYHDCYASLDRGSEPAIDTASFERPLPTNCNDADFSESSTWLEARECQITDLSFSLITFEAATVVIGMSSAALHPQNPDTPAWQYRLELANAYARSVDARVLQHCDTAVPMQRLLVAVGRAAAHNMVLRAVRPIEPQIAPYSPATPPNVSTLWVLQLAVVVLYHSRTIDSADSNVDSWRRMPWVPWHAIAVALAALCSIRDNPVADEAWALVDSAMRQHAGNVADSRTGMLWKPIEKLRRKAAAFRDEGLAQRQQGSARQPRPPLYSDPLSASMIPSGLPPTAQHQENSPAQPAGQQQQQQQRTQQQRYSPSAGANRNPGMRIEMPGGPDLPPAPQTAGPLPTPIATDMAESSFLDFPPDMLASVPDDSSWLDWEAIMKDMDEVNAAVATATTEPMQMS